MKLGIIGAGGVARGIHVPGFKLQPSVEIAAVCDTNTDAAKSIGLGVVYHDYQDLLERPDIDAVVIATPNYTHPEIAIAAFESGKHVLCEKPLSLNHADAASMLDAAAKSGKVHMTCFTYRYAPAVQYLRSLIQLGELGEIRTVRASYLMALSTHLLGWRSEKQYAGSGVLADIGSHLIHLVEMLAGDIATLNAMDRRFREDPFSDVEDWISFLAEFENGACGTFEISRVCAGRGAGVSEDMFIEVYGSKGSGVFSLQDPWGLSLAIGEDGADPARVLRRVDVPAAFLRVEGSNRDILGHDRRWGYRYDQAHEFVRNVERGVAASPSFEDGVRCQAVLDAALVSARKRSWVNL